MSVVTGVFEGVVVKAGIGKNGKPYKLYSAIVDGEKYSTGFDPVKAAVGDTVSLITTTNDAGYENMVEGSFKVVSGATPESAAPATSSAASSSKESDSRQSSIENQCVLKAAVELACVEGGIDAVAGNYKKLQAILHPPVKAAPKAVAAPVEEDDTPY